MKISKRSFLPTLFQNANRFEPEARMIKLECLNLAKSAQLKPAELQQYHDCLLFMMAHPQDEKLTKLCEQELQRLTAGLKKAKASIIDALENSGLPYTKIVTRFSHDLLEWLLLHKDYKLQLDYARDNEDLFSTLLRFTLPSAERELCSVGYSNNELLEALHIKTSQFTSFISEQVSGLEHSPQLKDYVFDLLEPELSVSSNHAAFSRSYNRFLKSPIFYHGEILKRFDHMVLLNMALPPATAFSADEKQQLIKSIKDSLTLMARETDPATYLDEKAVYYYQLERGIAIAIYGMKANRQMAFESYIGYTLFKNGFPAAYGGSWVFGRRALFGMNIFESFRGGESGYMMCQLLRVYRQAFGVSAFEVEPYQFGKNNPDGIASGAFWFYYRYGFRPIDKKLTALALAESKKIAEKKGYHSSYKTLEKFTESYISLDFEPTNQVIVAEWTEMITNFIAKQFGGNRAKALKHALLDFTAPTSSSNAVKEYALLAAALNCKEGSKYELLQRIAEAKQTNVFEYQNLLLRFFEMK